MTIKALAQRVAALEKTIHALGDGPLKQGEQAESNSNRDDAERKHNSLTASTSRPADRNPTPPQRPETDKKWYRSFEWWKSRLEVLAMLAGMGYAIVTYCQWRTQDASTKLAAKAFQADQRPYIVPVGVTLARTSDDVLKALGKTLPHILSFRVDYKNVGKSPARFVVHSLDRRLIDSPGGKLRPADRSEMDIWFEGAAKTARQASDTFGVTAPDGTYYFSPDPIGLSPEDWNVFSRGQIVVISYTFYKDALGGVYETETCHSLWGPGTDNQWHTCGIHNDIR